MMTNNVKQEAKRLYSCVMHDFHDNKERQEMWEREIQLAINQQVVQALERARDQMRIANINRGVHGISHLKVLTEPMLNDLIKEYKGE